MSINCFYEFDRKPVSDLESVLGSDSEPVTDFLARRGIYREDGETFSLEYVGIISSGKVIIPVLPKFLKSKLTEGREEIDSLKLIVNVLKKYDWTSEEDSIYSSSYNSSDFINSKLVLADFLLKDFMEYGLYENHIETYELNGDGEIDWENTIENEQAYCIKGKPFYLDLWTTDTVSHDEHYIRRLHKFVLNSCVEYVSNLEIQKLLNIIDVPNIDFSVNDEELGDEDFMIKMIDSQLKNEFGDRNILLLKKMKNFIEEIYNTSSEGFKLWGTQSFWSVWEKVCASVFRDESETYKKEIPKPNWISWNPYNTNEIKDTLIPDTLRKVDNNFFIFDAKYYNFNFDYNGKIKGKQPGIADVTKQFAYEMAFNKQFEDRIFNFFTIPTSEKTEVIGEVKLDVFDKLKSIKILSLNYEEVFKMYLNDSYYPKNFFYDIIVESPSK